WGDQVLAHASMLHPLPRGVAIDGASLHEPLSIAIHGLLRQPPTDGDPILVVGAGIIGLCAVAAITSMYPRSSVTVLAKYAHQAETAMAVGATNAVEWSAGGAHFDALAEIADTPVRGKGDGRMLAGGFP